ncbi:MAG: RNA methyltransferase [Pirellulaceae bacterium]|nr:RNA methyltransferase [Pirellulaceae bacterium]
MRLLITSTANPRIKAAAKLRDRSGRDEQQRIVIDGVREIHRAIVGGLELVELYYFPPLCGEHEPRQLLQRAEQAGCDLIEVSPAVMERLAYGNRVEGIVAIARPPRRKLSDFAVGSQGLFVVVEGVEKPGNLGAILRTADAAGIAGMIVADGGTDLYNPNAIRASLGAIFTVPVCAATSAQALEWLRTNQLRMLAARVDGARDYTAADFRGPAAIILGSEAFGLSDNWRAADIEPIRLPMLGQIDSLNLSATAAVLFYEALRQRRTT